MIKIAVLLVVMAISLFVAMTYGLVVGVTVVKASTQIEKESLESPVERADYVFLDRVDGDNSYYIRCHHNDSIVVHGKTNYCSTTLE